MIRCGWKVNGVVQQPFERYIGHVPIMVKVTNLSLICFSEINNNKNNNKSYCGVILCFSIKNDVSKSSFYMNDIIKISLFVSRTWVSHHSVSRCSGMASENPALAITEVHFRGPAVTYGALHQWSSNLIRVKFDFDLGSAIICVATLPFRSKFALNSV